MDYPIESIDSIRARGRAAFRDGVQPDACPYALGSAQCGFWLFGWLAEASAVPALKDAFHTALDAQSLRAPEWVPPLVSFRISAEVSP